MNFVIEVVYLSFALILLLILCLNLTLQILNIYQVEQSLYILTSNINIHSKIYSESLAYIVSQLYVKKSQWIEAIQILQLTIRHKQLYDSSNYYSLSNLYNAISYTYDKSSRSIAKVHYAKIASLLDNKYYLQDVNTKSG